MILYNYYNDAIGYCIDTMYVFSVKCKNRATTIFSVYSKNKYRIKYHVLFLA